MDLAPRTPSGYSMLDLMRHMRLLIGRPKKSHRSAVDVNGVSGRRVLTLGIHPARTGGVFDGQAPVRSSDSCSFNCLSG